VLSSKEQMEIIKGALAQDYRGPIYKLLEQAAAKKAEQMQGQQPQQPQQRETGGLVQSYESAPPSMINLPTGQKMGKADTLEDAGRYKTGGIKKYETGGDYSEEEIENAYENYSMGRELDDMDTGAFDSAVSYNQFQKLANTHGLDQAEGYYSNEEGKTTQPFSNWKKSSAKKSVSQAQIQSWSQESKDQYYNEIYGGNKMISPTEMMQMDQAAWDKANPTYNIDKEERELGTFTSEDLRDFSGAPKNFETSTSKKRMGQFGKAWAENKTGDIGEFAGDVMNIAAAGVGGTILGVAGAPLLANTARTLAQPMLRYGANSLSGFRNAFGATQGLGTTGSAGNYLYRGRQFMSGLYNASKVTTIPGAYNAVGNQAVTEIKGEGDHKNRLKTASKLVDLHPALSKVKDYTKIASDVASGDYTSAALRGTTTFLPGFKKSQFGTGIRHHTTKLVNKYLDTKPADENAGIIGDALDLGKTIKPPTNTLLADKGEEKPALKNGGFKKRKKLQYGGVGGNLVMGAGVTGVSGQRNDVQQAYSRSPEIGKILGNLDWGDAAKTYLNQTFNPTKWFDGKSATKAAYNELVPLNARLLIEDVMEEQLFNKDAVYGKYSPIAYLQQYPYMAKAMKTIGKHTILPEYKSETTEKDLSKGELEALQSVVENRKKSNVLHYNDYPGGGVGGTSMLEKMTDNNTVLETTLGQSSVKETDHDYTIKDTFDFNYNAWQQKNYREGKSEDNLYNYIRWQFAPKYGSTGSDGMPINIKLPKVGDGTKVTKTGAAQFDEGPKFAKKGGVRKGSRKVLYNKVNKKKFKRVKRTK